MRALELGDCVRIPDGRLGRVRGRVGRAIRVRVRRAHSKTHQFLMFPSSRLRKVDCPSGWMSKAGYGRYLKKTLRAMKRRRGRAPR